GYSWTGAQSILDVECLAEATGGLYIAAKNRDDLVKAFEKTLGCPMMSTVDAPLRSARASHRHACFNASPRKCARACQRALSSVEGDDAPKSANLWFVPCGTRAPLGAPIAAVTAPGPALVRPATLERADLSFSQLLTGTPSGPGGAPIPPERSCCVHEPAGAAPRPAP